MEKFFQLDTLSIVDGKMKFTGSTLLKVEHANGERAWEFISKLKILIPRVNALAVIMETEEDLPPEVQAACEFEKRGLPTGEDPSRMRAEIKKEAQEFSLQIVETIFFPSRK